MKSKEVTKIYLNKVLNDFQTGNIAKTAAIVGFAPDNIPCAGWSLRNRLLQFYAGTNDGRGYRQWQKIDRQVKKGAKSFQILVPCIKKIKKTDKNQEESEKNQEESGKNEISKSHVFFKTVNVFRYEDTDGKPIEHKKNFLPEYQYKEKLKRWGMSLESIPHNYNFWGCCYPDSIKLATDDIRVFYHELSHAAHARIENRLVPKTAKNKMEIVAELSAAALMAYDNPAQPAGKCHYQYIEAYAKKQNITVQTACNNVLQDVIKTVELIIN